MAFNIKIILPGQWWSFCRFLPVFYSSKCDELRSKMDVIPEGICANVRWKSQTKVQREQFHAQLTWSLDQLISPLLVSEWQTNRLHTLIFVSYQMNFKSTSTLDGSTYPIVEFWIQNNQTRSWIIFQDLSFKKRQVQKRVRPTSFLLTFWKRLWPYMFSFFFLSLSFSQLPLNMWSWLKNHSSIWEGSKCQ